MGREKQDPCVNCGQTFLPATPPQHIWRVSSYLLVDSALGAGGAYQIVRRYAGTTGRLRRHLTVK